MRFDERPHLYQGPLAEVYVNLARRSPSSSPFPRPVVVSRASSKTISRADTVPSFSGDIKSREWLAPIPFPKVQSLKEQEEPSLNTQIDSSRGVWSLGESDLGLVDIPETENDTSLWLSLLVAAKREHGRDGVLAIWKAMKQRRSLYDVASEGAKLFWSTILEAALHDENKLKDALLFSQWLLQAHSVQWPSLYSTTISYCLRNGQYRRAMQWHLRLMPNFDPGPENFGVLLREFAIIPEPDMQHTLQALYATSLHRTLYDELIPLLYRRGLSQHCNGWRSLFIHQRDLPRPNAESQPYLKYLARYYPTITLELEEQMVLGLNSPAYWNVQDDSLWDAMKDAHVDEAGITGRRRSDTLGARWFASSWIPLDFAIHAVHALGVRQIGPLSLQSIALREPTAHGVITRIEQLRKINIGIGHSTYSRVLKRFAENEDNELLYELLHTDIHPDVFDDPPVLASIRNKALEDGAWKTHRLLLAIQPAIVEESVDSTSNLLLQESVKHGQGRQALALLDDMRSMNIDVSTSTVQHICSNILDILPWNPKTTATNRDAWDMAIAYLTRLALLKKPVHSRYWQKIIFGLGKFGRIGELEDLCLGIIDTYGKLCASEGGLLPVHYLDTPPSGVDGSATDVFVPADLPIAHEHHPIRRIFDNPALHTAIVRWGFKAGFSKCCNNWDMVSSNTTATATSEYSVARGVRLLAILNKKGIPFRAAVVQEEVVRCLARAYLFWDKRGSRTEAGLPPLAAISELFNKAAGRDLLPNIAELRDLMERVKERSHNKP
ncbi:pentatricopeptide repeat domain-containing protein [Colletotrichum tofieldiae]|uniref:Pentatricopeptide repeat domain-containing protein n=1 Tax=Colletotrichum tofieldiae TaxID=708197 RepID=A0A166QBG8_9PEZI|nr:pentatricopeptide repeat domain-containing protein [Colletotrichum tofieldiae]